MLVIVWSMLLGCWGNKFNVLGVLLYTYHRSQTYVQQATCFTFSSPSILKSNPTSVTPIQSLDPCLCTIQIVPVSRITKERGIFVKVLWRSPPFCYPAAAPLGESRISAWGNWLSCKVPVQWRALSHGGDPEIFQQYSVIISACCRLLCIHAEEVWMSVARLASKVYVIPRAI